MEEAPISENPPETLGTIENSPETLREYILDPKTRLYIMNCQRLFLYGKDAALAEDLTQETVINALRGADKFRWEASPNSWLYRIARNAYVQHLRKEGRSKRAVTEVSTSDLGIEGLVLDISDEKEEGEIDFRLFVNALEETLPKLSPGDASIIYSLIDRKTAQEIADRLGITLANAKSRIHRARLALKKVMGDYAGKKLS